MFTKEYVVLDVETTGLEAAYEEIIELALVRISHGEIIERRSWLINPGKPLSQEISKLTGITNTMLEGKPLFSEIVADVEKFILGADLVGHNLRFDLEFLAKYLTFNADKQFYDTLTLAKIILPCEVNYKLGNIAKKLGFSTKELHRATADANITAEIFLKFWQIASNQEVELLTKLVKIFTGEEGLEPFFDKALKDKVKNSIVGSKKSFLPPLQLAPKLVREDNEDFKIDGESVLSWYKTGSILAAENPYFEERQPQIEMATEVIKAFNEAKHVVIEAGTGTGKSLAYLIPAAEYAVHSGQKVAIATNTISLQEQMLQKDIPQLEKGMLDLNVTLLKGRGHYLCLRKLLAIDNFHEFKLEEKIALGKFYFWITETNLGDQSELNMSRNVSYLWHSVASDAETCLGPKCKYYSRNCYFWHARRKADQSDLLIINHALLLSDCRAEKKILPDFTHLIIDEAHQLDKAASDHLGDQVEFLEINVKMQHLLGIQRLEAYSILGKIRKYLLSLSEHEQSYAVLLINLIDKIYDSQILVKEALEKLKNNVQSIAFRSNLNGDFLQTLRLKEENLCDPSWTEIFASGQAVALSLLDVVKYLNGFIEGLDDFPNEMAEKEQWKSEIINFLQYYQNNALILKSFFVADVTKDIKWFEFDNDCKSSFMIKSVPYELGETLKNYLYDKCQTIVFTSATITIEKRFKYYLGNLGLNLLPDKVNTLAVGSTFDYQRQTLVLVPSDVGNPQINEELYLNNVIDFMKNTYKNFCGHSLVLFTSHKQLRYVYENLDLPLEVTLLAQNISGSRNKILQNFCEAENACLLGANTFWEGIDLPGNLLNLLIIAKLPFMPPNYPLLEAKVEKVEKEGENAFSMVTLPGAVIRFKQGFGRLIRRKDDRGAVVILDGRLLSKRYGITFLRSLPIKSYFTGTQKEVIENLHQWFK